MTNSPIVTLGLCIKNVDETIAKTMQSIISQDFPHHLIELIVVEGFSNDQTLSIVKDYLSDIDITYRIYRNITGLGAARQIVVDKAQSKYIIWVDGDMVLSNTYTRGQVEFMEKNPRVAVAAGKYGLCLGHGVVADLENLVYVVDSSCGEKESSTYGYLPGTEGAIHRVDAVRNSGGFDVNIKGAAEDTELVSRLVKTGWKLESTDEVFVEFTRNSLLSLWTQYMWYGYGGHFVFHKDAHSISLLKMTPMAGFVAGLIRCKSGFKITHKKFSFLLPFHYTFKRVAWMAGFLKGHLTGYGHKKSN
ncbi:MAG: glycosyltransferase [Candidatus Bathyarchaeota archaeon]|nr:glycosyltransferase [Candidatus Bathyarchaeum sp.]